MTDQAETTVSDERLARLLAHEEPVGPLLGAVSNAELRLILTELSARRATADVTEAMREALQAAHTHITSVARRMAANGLSPEYNELNAVCDKIVSARAALQQAPE